MLVCFLSSLFVCLLITVCLLKSLTRSYDDVQSWSIGFQLQICNYNKLQLNNHRIARRLSEKLARGEPITIENFLTDVIGNSIWSEWSMILIAKPTFLLRFGGISGEFGSYFSETVEPKDR